jgi:hypothetical protein
MEENIELGSTDIGPVIRHLDEDCAVLPFFFEVQVVLITVLETNCILKLWNNPKKSRTP